MNYGDRITVATDVLVGKPIIKELLAKIPFRHSGESRNPGFSGISGPRLSPG
jgi:hypothetical protein